MKSVVKWILLSLVGAGLLVVLIPLGFWLYLTLGATSRLRQFRDATELVVQSREGDGWGTVEEIRDRSVIREVVGDFVAGDSGLDDEGPSSACPFFLRLNFLVGGTTKTVVVGTDDCQQFYL